MDRQVGREELDHEPEAEPSKAAEEAPAAQGSVPGQRAQHGAEDPTPRHDAPDAQVPLPFRAASPREPILGDEVDGSRPSGERENASEGEGTGETDEAPAEEEEVEAEKEEREGKEERGEREPGRAGAYGSGTLWGGGRLGYRLRRDEDQREERESDFGGHGVGLGAGERGMRRRARSRSLAKAFVPVLRSLLDLPWLLPSVLRTIDGSRSLGSFARVG